MRRSIFVVAFALLAPGATLAEPTTAEEVEAETTAKADRFEGTTILETPWLDVPIDPGEPRLERSIRFGLMAYTQGRKIDRILLLTVVTHLSERPIRANRALTVGGAAFQASTVDFDVSCPFRICRIEEQIGVRLTDQTLRAHRKKPLELSIRGHGRLDLTVPPFLVDGLLRRVDRELAGAK